jgi:hypothetical protein
MGACISLTVPETLVQDRSSQPEPWDEFRKPLRLDGDGRAVLSDKESPNLKRATTSWYHHCWRTLSFIMRSRNVFFLVLTFLVGDFARQSMTILVQYVSVRYSLTLANVS